MPQGIPAFLHRPPTRLTCPGDRPTNQATACSAKWRDLEAGAAGGETRCALARRLGSMRVAGALPVLEERPRIMTRHENFPDPGGIRAQLNHPIIDCDGHYTEFAPLFREQ